MPNPTTMNNNQILDLLCYPSAYDEEGTPIREYLTDLMMRLWRDGTEFNPSSPFHYGTDWQDAVYKTLVKNGLVRGTFDYINNEINDVNYREISMLITSLINTINDTTHLELFKQCLASGRDGADSLYQWFESEKGLIKAVVEGKVGQGEVLPTWWSPSKDALLKNEAFKNDKFKDAVLKVQKHMTGNI